MSELPQFKKDWIERHREKLVIEAEQKRTREANKAASRIIARGKAA